MASTARAKPPRIGKKLRADCNQGVVLTEGAKYQKTKQATPMTKIQWRFSQVKPKDFALRIAWLGWVFS
jgi:hypothetical protein